MLGGLRARRCNAIREKRQPAVPGGDAERLKFLAERTDKIFACCRRNSRRGYLVLLPPCTMHRTAVTVN